jgi:two-component system, chemotaxis family, response regulator Rcp1
MTGLGQKALTILLIEDNSADAFLTYETLKDSTVPNVVHVVKDAAKAFGHMLGKDGGAGMHIPDLILLDLNLPVMDGFSFLSEMGKNEELKDIPVFVLSASSAQVDVERARNCGARGYFVKPLDLEEFQIQIGELFRIKGTE